MRIGADRRAAPAWYPAVGALVGALAGLVRYAADGALGAGSASVLAVVALVVLTGALHQDGLADCADGLGARGGRERRLQVMRDPSIGVYGALALLLWLLLLVSALAALERDDAVRALVVAAALGRWAALLHARLSRPARADGLGASFEVGRGAVAVASAVAVAVAVTATGPVHAIFAVASAGVVAVAVTAWARTTLGGRTGDTLGASVALTEVVVCLALLAAVAT